MKYRRLALFFALAVVAFVPAFASAQQGPAPTCTITSNAGVVQKGGTVNLTWRSTNAVGGTITSIGSVGPSGTQGVIPTQTTEYVGIFTGAGGSARCSITIIVTLPSGGTTAPTSPPQTQTQTGQGQVQTTGAPGGGNSVFPTAPSVESGGPVIRSETGGLVPCTGLNCQACHLASLVQNIINFLVMLAIPLSALLFAAAGALYFTSEISGKKEQAKKILQKGVVGFIIVITAWLVVNTLFYVLFDQSQFPGGSWSSLRCVDDSQRPKSGDIRTLLDSVLGPVQTPPAQVQSPQTKLVCEGGYVMTSQGDCYNEITGDYASPVPEYSGPGGLLDYSGVTLTHSAAQQLFSSAGIGIYSSGNCSDGSNSTCTSFDGLQQPLAEQIVNLKQDCNCAVVLTGGTETGHAAGTYSHSNGYKVDLNMNSQLTSYITNHPMAVSGTLGSYSTYTIGNFVYMNEGNHWDVQWRP